MNRCHYQQYWGKYRSLSCSLQLWAAAFRTCGFTSYLPLDKAQTEHLLWSPDSKDLESESVSESTLNSLNKLGIELAPLFLPSENTHLSNLLGSQTTTSYYSTYSEIIKH